MRTAGLIIVLLFSATIISVRAQENKPDIPFGNYLIFGGGYSKIAVNEKLNTSLPYTGSCTSTALEMVSGTKKHFLYIRNAFSFGQLSPYKSAQIDMNTEDAYNESFGIAYYWRVYQLPAQNIFLYAGPLVTAKFGIRFKNGELGNSAMSYEGGLSTGLACKAAKYFNISSKQTDPIKQFRLEASLSLPVISKVYTPNYLGIAETAVTDNVSLIDWSSNYTGFLNGIETGLSLTYFLKNKNAIELAYSRDFFTTSPRYNPVKTLNQSVVFKLLFNLK